MSDLVLAGMFHRFCRRCWRRCYHLPAVLETNFLPIKKFSASISSWQHRYPTLRTGQPSGAMYTRPRDGFQPKSSCLQLLHALRKCSLFASSDTVFALSSGHGKCGMYSTMCYHTHRRRNRGGVAPGEGASAFLSCQPSTLDSVFLLRTNSNFVAGFSFLVF